VVHREDNGQFTLCSPPWTSPIGLHYVTQLDDSELSTWLCMTHSA
jgi:hypothetical protein